MPPRLQPESLLSLSRQCLVGLLLRNSRRVIGKGDATAFREEWIKWLELTVALLTPDLTNTIVAEVMDVMVEDKKLRGQTRLFVKGQNKRPSLKFVFHTLL